MSAPHSAARRHRIEALPVENTFATLPPAFYTRLHPTPVPAPYLVCASDSSAAMIDLDPREFQSDEFVQVFAGNRSLPGSIPLAAVYSGHQFGLWAGQLGDGRAILLGDVPRATAPVEELGEIKSADRIELQLKGSGLTPYSRMGDGRAVLRSSIREFLCSEAMAALGIPTSRALCVVGSDMRVMRELPETSAIATRMAPTFIRFGSFEHWFYNDKQEELKTLADFVIERFYPALLDTSNPYQELLREVTRRTAELIAQWQAVGFMHGVMNTDNMSILGITIDYGPFGFMEAFNAGHICNHSDRQGRYAYNMQPQIGHWNCFALGQALLPLIGEVEDAQSALEIYKSVFEEKLDALLHAKLGLRTREPDDAALIDAMFVLLQKNHPDFTLFFRRLGSLQLDNPAADEPLRDLFIDRSAFDAWAGQYRARLRRENSRDPERRAAMHAVNPKYVLRNYLAQIAIEKAQNKDFSEVAKLLSILEKPYDEQPDNERYAALPPDWANELEVSCSS